MLLGKAIPATMLFLLFVRSGVTTTTTISSVGSGSTTPSVIPSATTNISSVGLATPSVTNSATVSTNSIGSGGGPSQSTPSAMGSGSQGRVTPSPTAATGTQTATVTASVSVADVVWSEWRTKDPSKCKENCCDSGGGFTHQIRNCTINKQHCDLDKCEHYGAIEREVSCKTACDCMSNAGHFAPGLKTIIATLLICTLIVNMKP